MTDAYLTDDDIAVLLEALEAWESKDFGSQIMASLLGRMISRDDPASRAAIEAAETREEQKYKHEQQVRKERSVRLRAKLLDLRSTRAIDSVIRHI